MLDKMTAAAVDILVVVDTTTITNGGKIEDNIYLFDTNKLNGSGTLFPEGSSELDTVAFNGQLVRWRIQAISTIETVDIVSFGDKPTAGVEGGMISSGTCKPQEGPLGIWSGIVHGTQEGINII